MGDNVGAWLSPARQRCARVAVNSALVTATRAPGCFNANVLQTGSQSYRLRASKTTARRNP